jgi:hypothetical protein
MKKIILSALSILLFSVISAQSVAVGSSSAHPSAKLDITSNNKGFLPPLLSQSARLGISSPADGLLVYDTTLQRLYVYQNGVWRYIINSDYWTESTTRSAVFNMSDSIGIGTSIPNERLDVAGDIRARNNIIGGSTISVSGMASGGEMHANGNLIASGSITSGANISTNADLIMDNSSTTLQLKSAGINKTFLQLNGEDLRMGTNSGNENGDIVFRLNGEDVIKADANANIALLKFFGNLDFGKMVIGKSVMRPLSSGNMLTILYGRIFSDGSEGAMWPPTGSSARISTGVYDIDTHMAGVSSKGTIVVTAAGTTVPRLCTGRYLSTTKFRVEIFNLSGTHVDNDFYFMINDPLN